jgi:hypothetical protein
MIPKEEVLLLVGATGGYREVRRQKEEGRSTARLKLNGTSHRQHAYDTLHSVFVYLAWRKMAFNVL